MAPPVTTAQARVSCLLWLLLASSVRAGVKPEKTKMECYKDVKGTIYDYEAISLDGKERIQFKQFTGKFILFVNVATYCDLTAQYLDLNTLQEELKVFSFVVLGFPCNQFGKQEPGENSEILPGLKYVRPGEDYVPNFQLFAKGDVNGEKEQGLFTFLKRACPHPSETVADSLKRVSWEPVRVHDIRWNFEKFLVGPDGVPLMRWAHQVPVSAVKADILAYLEHLQTM